MVHRAYHVANRTPRQTVGSYDLTLNRPVGADPRVCPRTLAKMHMFAGEHAGSPLPKALRQTRPKVDSYDLTPNHCDSEKKPDSSGPGSRYTSSNAPFSAVSNATFHVPGPAWPTWIVCLSAGTSTVRNVAASLPAGS